MLTCWRMPESSTVRRAQKKAQGTGVVSKTDTRSKRCSARKPLAKLESHTTQKSNRRASIFVSQGFEDHEPRKKQKPQLERRLSRRGELLVSTSSKGERHLAILGFTSASDGKSSRSGKHAQAPGDCCSELCQLAYAPGSVATVSGDKAMALQHESTGKTSANK